MKEVADKSPSKEVSELSNWRSGASPNKNRTYTSDPGPICRFIATVWELNWVWSERKGEEEVRINPSLLELKANSVVVKHVL